MGSYSNLAWILPYGAGWFVRNNDYRRERANAVASQSQRFPRDPNLREAGLASGSPFRPEGPTGVLCTAPGRGVKTLAPNVAVQLGFDIDQPEQLPPRPNNEIPAGWHGIVDSFIEVTTNCGSEVVLEFGSGRGRLSVAVPAGSDERILGAAAAAIAASSRTDAETGQVPPLRKGK
jgi:hypothetical protein